MTDTVEQGRELLATFAEASYGLPLAQLEHAGGDAVSGGVQFLLPDADGRVRADREVIRAQSALSLYPFNYQLRE